MQNNYYKQLLTVLDKLTQFQGNKKKKQNINYIGNKKYSTVYTHFNENDKEKLELSRQKEKLMETISNKQDKCKQINENNANPYQKDSPQKKDTLVHPDSPHILPQSITLSKTSLTHQPPSSHPQSNKYLQILKLGYATRTKSKKTQISQQNLQIKKRIASIKSTFCQSQNKFQKYRYHQTNNTSSKTQDFTTNINITNPFHKLLTQSTQFLNQYPPNNYPPNQNSPNIHKQNTTKYKNRINSLQQQQKTHIRMKSTSEINRQREEKRIQMANIQLRCRLIMAMSKCRQSKYFQINKNDNKYQNNWKKLSFDQKSTKQYKQSISNHSISQQKPNQCLSQVYFIKQPQPNIPIQIKSTTLQSNTSPRLKTQGDKPSPTKLQTKSRQKTTRIIDKLQQSIQIFLQNQHHGIITTQKRQQKQFKQPDIDLQQHENSNQKQKQYRTQPMTKLTKTNSLYRTKNNNQHHLWQITKRVSMYSSKKQIKKSIKITSIKI